MNSPVKLKFNDLMKDDFSCAKLVKSICRSNFKGFRDKRIYEGSRILYEIGNDRIIKVFSRNENEFCVNEAAYLELLQGKLSIETPELIERGIHDGYPFLIMQKLEGPPLKSVWNNISQWEKKCILTQIAETLKELHSLPVELAVDKETNWKDFITAQKKNLLKNHIDFGLDQTWGERIVQFIESTEAIEFTSKQAICHTEIMREHLFLARGANGYKLTGLIDFEPSMIAIPEYDFCSVGLFITSGSKNLFKHFLRSYGYTENPLGIMRMLLLHRYSNMKWFISTIPDTIKIHTIEDLADYWF